MINDQKSSLPKDRLWQPTTAKWFAVIFGISLVYAIIRYHLVGDVAWQNFPLFILNKIISLSAVAFVACSYLIGKIFRWHDHDKALRLVVIKFCGLMGFFLAGIHAIMSVFVLTPGYFSKYFDDSGRLNLQGELGMAVGIVALFFLMSPAITTLPMMAKELGGWRWKRTQRVGYIALILVVIHLITLGLKGWLSTEKWPAGILAISLIAFIVAVIPLVVKRKLVSKREQRKKQNESKDVGE